jgi:Winged helix DNA-binding domain
MPTPSDVLSRQALNRALLARMFTRNGIFSATVLVDGFVAGMWKITRSRAAAELTIEPFGPLGPRDRDSVTDEGGRLLAFAAPEAAVREIRFAPLT